MSAEHDWERLGEAWRATRETVDLAPLRKIVASNRRRLLAVNAAEGALLVVFAALSIWVAHDGIQPWEAIWLITLWTFTCIAVVFAVHNRRGIWNVLGESAEEYVRITRLRAVRQIRSLWFACGLFVAELIAVVTQLVWFDRFTLFAALLLAASAVALAIWVMVVRRRVERKLAMLEEFDGGR